MQIPSAQVECLAVLHSTLFSEFIYLFYLRKKRTKQSKKQYKTPSPTKTHNSNKKKKNQHVSNRNNLPHNHSYQAFWPKNDATTKNCSSPLAFFIFPWFSKQFKCISTWMIFDAGFVSGFVSADKLF